ncbi:hypothetical protein ACHAXS_000816, partial [Conticribra weissflogii]
KLLSQLCRDQNLIITPADKNLRPVLLTRNQYITATIDKHLGNKNVYQRLTITQYQNATGYAINCTIHQWYQKHQSNLEDSELIFLHCCCLNATRKCLRFYLNVKMHKTPWKTRPVLSTCGTFLHALSWWVNMHLQKLTFLLQRLPPNARVFTADAVPMYTNIDTAHALQAINHFLLKMLLNYWNHSQQQQSYMPYEL